MNPTAALTTVLNAPGPAELMEVLALCKAHPDYTLFVRAMMETPEDDTVRLVFADWLQERGCEWHAQRLRAFRVVDWRRAAEQMAAGLAPVLDAAKQAAQAFSSAMMVLTPALAAFAAALPSIPPLNHPASTEDEG